MALPKKKSRRLNLSASTCEWSRWECHLRPLPRKRNELHSQVSAHTGCNASEFRLHDWCCCIASTSLHCEGRIHGDFVLLDSRTGSDRLARVIVASHLLTHRSAERCVVEHAIVRPVFGFDPSASF